MEKSGDTITQRVEAVRETIRRAASSFGRGPDEIELMAAVKTRTSEECAELLSAGVLTIGENKVQEGLEHIEKLRRMNVPPFRTHFIGRLQSNKVRKAVRAFDSIDSLDSEKIASRVSKTVLEEHLVREVMIEVNLGKEPQKGGVFPEDVAALAGYVNGLEGVVLTGLMGIPPWSQDPEASRPYLRTMRDIFGNVKGRHPHPERFRFLSMGMSNDFTVAVEEGATMVRIGTALFGPRRYK